LLGCLPDVDQRTAPAKHYKSIAADLLSDLGGSGECSTGEVELIRRISALGVLCSQVESKIVKGEALSDAEHANYIAALNAQSRCLARVGLRRRQRDVTPTVAEYIAAKEAAE